MDKSTQRDIFTILKPLIAIGAAFGIKKGSEKFKEWKKKRNDEKK